MNAATLQKLQGLGEPLRTRVAALLQRTGDAVWIESGRRSIEEQVQLRRAHCGTSFYDVYEKPWNQCSPPTARPGHSPHERGEAVDLAGDLALAARHAREVGLERPIMPKEPWHFEVDDDAATAQLLGGDPTGGVLGGAIGIFGGQLEDAVGGALGKLVEPFLGGMRRIALTGLLVAGGVVLVVLGGLRGTQEIERKLT